MKKPILVVAVIGLFAVTLGGWYVKNNFMEANKGDTVDQSELHDNGMEGHIFGKEMYLDAKLDEFNCLEDVEATADEIVVAQKISQD
ncbi:hypothetical protein IGI37_003031 [Enterococcus sp. AZ194]|uniref:hypothetical protein n=1 Tax=Enterococcus sp. AZ194 TaxID=2774629 RepID=UPI003F2219EB